MAELCSCVLWKVTLLNDEIGYLAKETSKQSVEGSAWFLLSAYRKMLKETHELKKELLSKKQPELEDLENSQPIHIAKHDKACYEENTKGVAGQTFDKEIMGVIRRFHQPFRPKPEIEMGLYQQDTGSFN